MVVSIEYVPFKMDWSLYTYCFTHLELEIIQQL